jgi:exopolyphosphatase/guanosine-5'-triphosphate,3'-diphosphate pyrophosphatase
VRLAVLDVGSNSVKVQVVDAYPGAPPLPIFAASAPLRLSENLDHHGSVTAAGRRALVAAVSHAAEVAYDKGATELIAFATQAIRQAGNGDDLCQVLGDEADVAVEQLTGEDEARFTFLAARRWIGWSGGRLLVLDIGGGSFEIAYGRDEEPSLAVSLPLGAGELTRSFLPDDPARKQQADELRRHVSRTIGDVADRLRWEGVPACVVGTSKTFKQLARLSGAPGQRKGPFVERMVERQEVHRWVTRLASMDRQHRARQRGVARSRARQIVAGAVVADTAMRLLDVDQLRVCPWALREGVLLRRLDRLDPPSTQHDRSVIRDATATDIGRDHTSTRYEDH